MNTNEVLKDVLEQVQEYREQCEKDCEDEPRCQRCNGVCFDSIERMITGAMNEDGKTVKKLRKGKSVCLQSQAGGGGVSEW